MQGHFSMVYISPELLLCCTKWRERDVLVSVVYQKRTVGFIVDEAHCVKKQFGIILGQTKWILHFSASYVH